MTVGTLERSPRARTTSAPSPDRPRPVPRTGWTRAHWEALADRQLEALVPYATPGFAQYRLPGRSSWSGVVSDGLEGYARSFLLASFRIAGADGKVDPHLIERYTQGLTSGTLRDGPEAWPVLTDCSQQMVEAASIAIGLHETRPWIWDTLDTPVQERVVEWLSGFVGARTWDNNWRLFQVVSEQFLASVGAPHSRDDIEGGLERIEDWYVGDGWYSDGDGRNFDYYIGWAMHLYPLLWARIAGPDGDGGRGAVYRERLARFLSTYPQFFGADGAPVHQGRSLTYRFAATAPVWLGALADCTPLAPGLTRRLASGTARHFVERGVPDERGLLPLGWYGTHLPTTQPYSGPASPYWASKAFLGLLLPADHPVWTEREQPLPVEQGTQYTALLYAGLAPARHRARRHRPARQPRQRPQPARRSRRGRPALREVRVLDGHGTGVGRPRVGEDGGQPSGAARHRRHAVPAQPHPSGLLRGAPGLLPPHGTTPRVRRGVPRRVDEPLARPLGDPRAPGAYPRRGAGARGRVRRRGRHPARRSQGPRLGTRADGGGAHECGGGSVRLGRGGRDRPRGRGQRLRSALGHAVPPGLRSARSRTPGTHARAGDAGGADPGRGAPRGPARGDPLREGEDDRIRVTFPDGESLTA